MSKATIKVHLYSGHKDEVNCCVISPNEKLLVTASDDCTLIIWNFKSKRKICVLNSHSSAVNSCTFSPNSQTVASGSYDGEIKIWGIDKTDCLKTLKAHSKCIQQVTFSSDGQLLSSVSWDKSIIVWEITTGTILYNFIGHTCVNTCSFSLDGVFLATGGWDSTICLWRFKISEKDKSKHQKWLLNKYHVVINCGKKVYKAKLFGHSGNIQTVVFSTKNLLASGGTDHKIILWNPKNAVAIKEFEGHFGWIRALNFSINSLELVSVADDGSVRVWNVLSGDCIQLSQNVIDITSNCCFSTTGSLYIFGSLV